MSTAACVAAANRLRAKQDDRASVFQRRPRDHAIDWPLTRSDSLPPDRFERANVDNPKIGQHDLHMALITGDVARRAFDTVAAAAKVETIEELNAALDRVLSPMGFDVFGGVDAVDSRGRPNVRVLFGKSHPSWVEHYQANRYAKDDAMIREMVSSTDPLFWSDLSSRREVLPQEMQILNEAADFGLTNGFVTPLHNVDGSMSAVLLMGRHVDSSDPDVRTAAHLLSIHYGGVARRIHQQNRAAHSSVRLSERQLECLKWVRAGKSTTDIADILGLSTDTVNTHLERARQALGVRTRVQAVAEAALHGLMQL